MPDQVWISEVISNGDLGNRLGIRHKWFGEPWEAPYARHYVPNRSDRAIAGLERHVRGHTLTPEEFPEASAVYSMSHFRQARDVFFIGGFLGIKGKVAKVLSKFDFGVGGGLVPYTIYEADEKTPLPGPHYLVNFGPMKDCFLPEVSAKVENLGPHYQTGEPLWSLNYLKDGDIAVSPAALEGADLWMCPYVKSRIFMSDRVVEALRIALSDSMFAAFMLSRCRVVG